MATGYASALQPLDPAADALRLQKAVRQWRSRSRLIHFFRRALPFLMAAIMITLGVFIAMETLGRRTEPPQEVVVRMLNPRFQGRDEDGRAYVLTASAAVRDPREFQRVHLTDPALDLETADSRGPMKVRAKTGVYLEGQQLLTLEKDVQVDDPTGWRFTTQKARIDTKRDIITGDVPIQGVSATERISGNSYAIYNRGERVQLRGNVRSTLSGG
jgi:lipopolysaccharide export system protein LptC